MKPPVIQPPDSDDDINVDEEEIEALFPVEYFCLHVKVLLVIDINLTLKAIGLF